MQKKLQASITSEIFYTGECKIFIAQTAMFNHQKICSGREKCIDIRLLSPPIEETSESFKKNVIGTMRNDTVGILSKKDRTILIYGYWSFQKVKRSQNVVGARDLRNFV